MGSSPMEKIGECNGVTLYFADSRFERPGVYYWDGADNVRAWPPEETAAQAEINELRAELARIEENGTPWVPELLEWLEKHGCCPERPFTDYELIESLEARFGTPKPPQPSASVGERARELLAREVDADSVATPGLAIEAEIIRSGKSNSAFTDAALRAIESALTQQHTAAAEHWHGLYRKECRLRQDDAARYGQQIVDLESVLTTAAAGGGEVGNG